MRTIQLAPALLCQHQELERHRQCLGPAARAFGHALTEPHGREARLDGVARAQMLPVLGREVEEGEQGFAVLDEAVDRLLIFGREFRDEGFDASLGLGACLRT